jgi:HPt (histidine-containing phosphotransfer) domain-containing protein
VVARIVSRFLEESEQRLAALRLAGENDDPPALERAAHALKGIAGTVGANEMLELAVRLEHMGREGRTQDGVELVHELELALNRARPIFGQVVATTRTA